MAQAGHLPTRIEVMDGLVAVSMMICGNPRVAGSLVILSACDSVWGAVDEVPMSLRRYISDDLGNAEVVYGGFIYIHDARAFDELRQLGLYACIRAVDQEGARILEAPITQPLGELNASLVHVGWDVAHGNGWLSASCDGIYPLDVFSTSDLSPVDRRINRFGLFEDAEDARRCCDQNNKEVTTMAPWYPVAVLVDQSSLARIETLRIRSWVSNLP